MMKSILSCLFFIFATNFFAAYLFADDTVRITNPTDMHVYGTTNGTAKGSFLLGSTKPSDGNGLTEATAASVYVPISNTESGHDDYFSLYHDGYSLFDISDTSYSYISFPLTVNVNSTFYLYAAVFNGTNYRIVNRAATNQYSSPTETVVNIKLKDICAVNTTICEKLGTSSTTFTSNQTAKIYFFITTNSNHSDDVVLTTPGDGDGGVFFQAKLSNKVYKSTDTTISLVDPVARGDGRIIANYSISKLLSPDDFDHVVVFLHAKAASAADLPSPPAANLAVGSSALYSLPDFPDAMLVDQNYSSIQSDSKIIINSLGFGQPLANGTSYLISIGLMDKYKFVTNLSNAEVGTPTGIEELLKKQACYLLTAGFGEEHYIITFFRHYRDQVLANTLIGKQFIKLYYNSAPHYALVIYQSEWMRLVIRSAAFSLYFFFNYYWVVLIFFLSCYFVNLRKYKVL